jgi:Uncharacterized protein conserved in bacteria
MKNIKTKIIITFTIMLLTFLLSTGSYAGISIVELKTTEKTIRVTGTGFSPDNPNFSIGQKQKMAERAAVVDGYRKLLEQIGDIKVGSKTTIKDYATQKDEINVEINGILRGAKQIAVRELKGGGAEVDMEIRLGRDFYDSFQPYIKTLD